MKILFAVSHPGFLRNFESGLRHLLSRGHDIHIHFGKDADPGSVTGSALLHVLDRLRASGGVLSTSVAATSLSNEWSALAADLRMARDFWRYLGPEYDDASLLRERARAETPAFAARLAQAIPFRVAAVRHLVDRLVHGMERRLPIPEQVFGLLDEHRPDIVVITPLIYFRSDQVYLLRAARGRAIRTVYAAGSWDHLTTKGLIHDEPDRVVVWNEAQITECMTLHGIALDRCRATGAQAFDHWFDQRPIVDRAAFCRQAGLPGDRPIVLYLCSSTFIAGDERGFVREWLTAVRAAPEPLRSAAVLIRPHPQNAEQWRDEHHGDGLTAVWPREGINPVSETARADFYHSIYFSDAVVGVNTSAQIESAIVGRPVFSILSSRYAGTQKGTLHFRHMEEAGGGLLHTAASLEEHTGQLRQALTARGEPDARSARFVATFVRPAGADRPAGDVFADAVEQAPPGVRPLSTTGLGSLVTAALLRPLASAADAAGRLRATKAKARFQRLFLPAPGVFVPEHLRSHSPRRVVFAAATREDVERFVAFNAEFAAMGGRAVLCVPDGSQAGDFAKRSSASLQRCVTVGLPSRDDVWAGLLALTVECRGWAKRLAKLVPAASTSRLLLRKFRTEAVVAFHESAGAPAVEELSRAARDLAIPFIFAQGERSCEEILRTAAVPRVRSANGAGVGTSLARLVLFVTAVLFRILAAPMSRRLASR